MLERYRDVMNQIHMPDDCDWKIRSAMEKKARETHRRRPLRRISLAAAVVAILVTTALAATFLRSQTFQEMLGREAVQWEDQIQEGVLAELTMDHFRVQVVQSLFTTDSANVVLEITPLDAEGQARLADVDLLYDLSAFNRDHPDPLPDGGAISWDHWVLPDGTETCKRIGISVFTVNRPFVQGESFPLYLAMQDRPIPQTKEDTTQPTEASEQPPEILAEGICMMDIPTVCTSARALTLGCWRFQNDSGTHRPSHPKPADLQAWTHYNPSTFPSLILSAFLCEHQKIFQRQNIIRAGKVCDSSAQMQVKIFRKCLLIRSKSVPDAACLDQSFIDFIVFSAERQPSNLHITVFSHRDIDWYRFFP